MRSLILLTVIASMASSQVPDLDRQLLDAAANYRTSGASELIADLLAKGAHLNTHNPDTGDTPLMRAAISRNVEFLKALVALGADVNEGNRAGATALMYAVQSGDIGSIEALLAAGSQSRAKAGDGSTAVSAAYRIHRPDIVELLRKAGADVRHTSPVPSDELVQLSRLTQRIDPEYPAGADGAPSEDPVKFDGVIGRDGAVLQLTYASGPASLEEPARRAAIQWRYEPAVLDGEYVEVRAPISVAFPGNMAGTEFDAGMASIAKDVARVKAMNIRRDGMGILEKAVRSCSAARPPNNACADACDWYGMALQNDTKQETLLKVEPLYLKALDLRVRSPHSLASVALSLELEGIALEGLFQMPRGREMLNRASEIRALDIKAMETAAQTGALMAGAGAPAMGANAGGSTFKVGGGVTAPVVTYKIDPQYADEARLIKYSGTVTLSVIVNTEGRARSIQIVKGLGLGLDEKAVAAVQSWVFRPGMKDGHPVNVQAQIQVNFKLL